jgi:hypothetical protein
MAQTGPASGERRDSGRSGRSPVCAVDHFTERAEVNGRALAAFHGRCKTPASKRACAIRPLLLFAVNAAPLSSLETPKRYGSRRGPKASGFLSPCFLHGDLVREPLRVPLGVLEEKHERVGHDRPTRRSPLGRERAAEPFPLVPHAHDEFDFRRSGNSSFRLHEGGGVGLFTINFELGEATLKTLRDIAKTSVVRFELGPETRAMIERIAAPRTSGERSGNGEGTVGRLVEKGAKALRSD